MTTEVSFYDRENSINFIINSGALSATVTYYDPGICPIKDWLDLFQGKDCELVFSGCDGEVTMACENSKVFFYIGKFGSGGDGTMRITVDYKDCVAAFKECHEYIKSNPNFFNIECFSDED